MNTRSSLILLFVFTLTTDMLSQIKELKTENLNQEEWEAARDYYAVEVIKLLAKLDTLNAEIDSLLKLNDSLGVLDCEYHLYNLSGTTYEDVAEFRIRFLETEDKIINKSATSEEIKQKYLDEISISPLKCLPEFSDRFRVMSKLFESLELPETSKKYTVIKGDNLRKIAKKFFGDIKYWQKLWNANKDIITDPDLIYPGQELKIP